MLLELPVDRPRRPWGAATSMRAEYFLPPDLMQRLHGAGCMHDVSLQAVLLGGFVAMLHRLTGQEEIAVGIPADMRVCDVRRLAGGDGLDIRPAGFAVHMKLGFVALIQACSTAMQRPPDARKHMRGSVPGGNRPDHCPGDSAVANVVFNLESAARIGTQAFSVPDVTHHALQCAKCDIELFVNLRTSEGGLLIEAQYNADLFDEVTVLHWLEMLHCILDAVTREPAQELGQLQVLSARAADALRALQPERVPLKGNALAHAGFLARVPLQPDRPAVRDGTRRYGYGELDLQSNRLARALRARGVERGQRVGLCLERSLEMVVSMLGILKAGAAYVPLDPAFPQARLDHYAKDARLSLIVTNSAISTTPRHWCPDAAGRVFEIDADTDWLRQSNEALPQSVQDAGPEDAAYVIYTSGSTGVPKGVIAHHRGVANLLQWMQKESGVHNHDRIAAVTTLSFDMAVPDLLLPLAAGSELVMVQREVARDGERLAAALKDEGITLLQATPGMWQALIDANWCGAPGFRGWTGGETLSPRLALALCERMKDLWNGYGPTETTVKTTAWRVQPEEVLTRGVSIGTPVDNTEIWILDALLQPCPIGVPGEICIAGEGVTIGYLDRPELTRERFVTVDILGVQKRIYRSGDRGRWRNDGVVEHLGRIDFQLKVRGYRIEPGEIEARCCEVAGVSRSVVVAREDSPGDVRLVAYLALAPGATFDAELLMSHLKKILPWFMLPQHVVTLSALPTLQNGKIDRASLPAPQASPAKAGASSTATLDDDERRVLAAMEKVLGVSGLDPHADFFASGGHSLLAGRLTARLSRDFEVTLPLRAVFEAPTVAKLAAHIRSLKRAGVGLDALIAHTPGRTSAPMTVPQQRIHFMESLMPGRSVYNLASAQRLTGRFNFAFFEDALCQIISRQPSLRTRLETDEQSGQPVQAIDAKVAFKLPFVDLRTLPGDQREAELLKQMQALADSPVDLARAPMAHAALYRIDEEEHAFLFVPHHLIWDGWSFDLMQHELATLYDAAERGEASSLAPLTTTHGDYAQWMEHWMKGPACEEQLAFWRQRLASTKTIRPLCSDLPRRAGKSGQGGAHWFQIDQQKSERLRLMARELDVTLSMLTFGIYALTIAHVTGNDAIIIANPVRGRLQPETEDVFGFFNNVLPVPLTIDHAQPLSEFMRYVKGELLSAMNNQTVPFERLIENAKPASQNRGAGPYQSMFSFQDARERSHTVGSLKTKHMHLAQRGATDDVGVWLVHKAHGLEGMLIYNADVFLRETGAQLRERYIEVLERALDSPNATLAQIVSAEGSSSATYLRKLSMDGNPAGIDSTRRPVVRRPWLDAEQLPLGQVWAEVLGIDIADIREDDNFFELGGDSLLMLRAVDLAQRKLGLIISPRRYLFESIGQLTSVDASDEDAQAQADVAISRTVEARRMGFFGRTLGNWFRRT
ncbi:MULTISPECIES: amino acid adenylation domain-containing protein [unclassified Variovorax]|uniref:amino acid adenylation domain-containing protein n=1 Tax=unclassified Variovorax TaxID=663243 RepID=UPI00210C606F|nr:MULTISPECIES: amino acid adenylation domain-containing protein [unclassified Variovorax]